jgi:hypothetical protein
MDALVSSRVTYRYTALLTVTQAQLASIDARLKDTEADNERLAELIDKIEQAFSPILEALQHGGTTSPIRAKRAL